MSETTTPPAKSNQKLLIIISSAIVVLLAIIAIAVSSQAIRANDEAAAKENAVVEARAAEQALADQKVAEAEDANRACEEQVLKKHPTAVFKDGNTRSTLKASAGSYETVGTHTDAALYGNSIPMQFVCSSTKGSGTSWNVVLETIGRQ